MFSRSSNTLFLCVFFHYCIDARTTQYYLPLLATTICLIDLYLCTWFIAICVHVVWQVGLVEVVWPANIQTDKRFKTRAKDPVISRFIKFTYGLLEETRENSQRHISVRRTRETLRMKWRDIEIHISHFETKHRGIITRPSAFTECCNHSWFSFFNYVGSLWSLTSQFSIAKISTRYFLNYMR